jgi:hypothetical protein
MLDVPIREWNSVHIILQFPCDLLLLVHCRVYRFLVLLCARLATFFSSNGPLPRTSCSRQGQAAACTPASGSARRLLPRKPQLQSEIDGAGQALEIGYCLYQFVRARLSKIQEVDVRR